MRIIIKMIVTTILIFLSIPALCNALNISEIMFNPEGADTGREWMLLDVNETECNNLSNYRLFESGTNHNIYAYNFSEYNQTCGKAIICNDMDKFLTDYPELNLSRYKIYRSSFSLSNTGELLEIKSGDEIIDGIDYSEILTNLTIAEGYSLMKMGDVWTSSVDIGGTLVEKISMNESAYNETDNITNNTNTTDITNTTSENVSVDTCNASIYILLKENKTVFDNENAVKFYNKITFNYSDAKQNYSVEYWIEDLFGNIVKNKVSTDNDNEKSYTPKIDEHEKTLVIKNVLKNISCNVEKGSDEKIVVVKNDKYTPQECSKCASTKCEKCECNEKVSSKECVPNTIIKTINNCTANKTNNKVINKTANASSVNEGISILEQGNDFAIKSNNQSTNNSKNAGQPAGMVLYESPNYKNKFYAIIGLVILGLAGLTITIYRIKQIKAKAQ